MWQQRAYIMKEDLFTAAFAEDTGLPVQSMWLYNGTNETKTYTDMSSSTPPAAVFELPHACAAAATKCL